ncbi:unnamed protein product [Owenia fusiformis]|uniref:DUF985 domain-containing protein n=1 Tax=Owenia fusiformis TaxID=6347 RepID=A0A8S4PCP4_OWEFU|nr:unnamed protein product [Owenia fusiformis]
MDCKAIVEKLGLIKHPADDGAHFKELWRSTRKITVVTDPESYDGERTSGTSIYFLMQEKALVTFHILPSDELFYWHRGGNVKVHLISKDGVYRSEILGDMMSSDDANYQVRVPRNHWYAVEMEDATQSCLYSAVVVPGWEAKDWKEGKRDDLISKFPKHRDLIERLTTE